MQSSQGIAAITLGVIAIVSLGISGVWYNRYVDSFRGGGLASTNTSGTTTSPYNNQAKCFDGQPAKANSYGVKFEGHDWGITYFGGSSDIRIDSHQCAMERIPNTNNFYYPKDKNGRKICNVFPKGSRKGLVGYSETGSISGEYLRNIDPGENYAAYPLDKNVPASAQLGIDKKNGSVNTYKVKDQCLNVCAVNSNGVIASSSAKLIDTGPGQGRTVDVSEGLLNKLKNVLGSEPTKVDIQLGECTS